MPPIARQLWETELQAEIQKAIDAGSSLCVGLDPSPHQLELWGLSADESGLRAFVDISLNAIDGVATIAKPQVAFFEEHGFAGLKVLGELITALKAMGIFVIADAKRGDIGSTMRGYLNCWLSDAGFGADALTVHSFLGMDLIADAAAATSLRPERGFFALCATSNPEGAVIQKSLIGERTLARYIFDEAERISSNYDHQIGVVVGATLNLEDYGLSDLKSRRSEVPILAPGFGAQGAKLSDVGALYGASRDMVIPSMSRELLGSDWRGFRGRILEAKGVLS